MDVVVVSNSSGRQDAVTAAVDMARELGCASLIHCGDVGGRHVLDALAGMEAAFVWGDRDRDRMGLLRHAQKLDIACFGVLGEMELNGKRIAVVHGDDPKLTRRILDEQQYDYLLCGHAAAPEDRRVGKTRVISPGSLYGTPQRTLALLDTLGDEVRFLTL